MKNNNNKQTKTKKLGYTESLTFGPPHTQTGWFGPSPLFFTVCTINVPCAAHAQSSSRKPCLLLLLLCAGGLRLRLRLLSLSLSLSLSQSLLLSVCSLQCLGVGLTSSVASAFSELHAVRVIQRGTKLCTAPVRAALSCEAAHFI